MTPDQIALLSKKLDPNHVKSRSQSGRSLSYIEGWFAIAEANRIFGFDGWHRETVYAKCVSERDRKIGQAGRDGHSVSYVAMVRVRVGDIIREGTGAGHGIDADLGLAHESAIKEAETDATKRALMTFGNPFGLALYDKTMANVGHEEPEDTGPTGSEKLTLQTMLFAIGKAATFADLKVWWSGPENQRAYKTLPPDMQRQVDEAKEQRKAELTADLRMAG